MDSRSIIKMLKQNEKDILFYTYLTSGIFDREDFYKEMTFDELNKLECRILGL